MDGPEKAQEPIIDDLEQAGHTVDGGSGKLRAEMIDVESEVSSGCERKAMGSLVGLCAEI